jgi:O-antigen/teichoic acid export membrane protein
MLLYQRAIMMIGAIIPLLFFRTLEGILSGVAIGGVVGAIFANINFYRVLHIRFEWGKNWREWHRIIKTSIPLGIGGAFGSWYLRVGAIIIAWVWSSREVGEYSAAFRIFEITYIIPTAVMSIGVPHLSSALNQGRTILLSELRRIGIFMLFSGLVWSVFIYFLSSLIVNLFFGEKFLAAVPILKVFGVAGGLVFINYFVTHLMVVFSLQKRHAVNIFFSFTFCVLTSVIFVSNNGSIGAAWSLLLTEVFLFIATTASLLNSTIHRKIYG